MSSQWEIQFRIQHQRVDGKDNPSRSIIKERMESWLQSMGANLPVVSNTLKVTNKAQGGRKSKDSGADYERKIAKKLGEWWWGQPFRRTPNSGAWDKQAQDGTVQAAGDLFAPPEAGFPFCVECKHRKDPLNLFAVQTKTSDCVFDWWDQCAGDAKMSEKHPLLVMCCNRIEYIIFRPENFVLFNKMRRADTIHPVATLWRSGTKLGIVMQLKDFLEEYGRPKRND